MSANPHPDHYANRGIEPIERMIAEELRDAESVV